MATLKFRITLLTLLLLYFFVNSLFNIPEEVYFNVSATNNYQLKNIPIKKYQHAYVLPQGKMVMNNLNKFQRWVAPEINGNDVLQLFFIIIYLSIIAIWLYKLNIEKPFIKDISEAIKLLGYGILIFSFIIYIRDSYFSRLILVESIHEFSFKPTNSWLYGLGISTICVWLSNAYKKANELQKEQNLTV